ncbi:hypothetical protein LCGC14_2862210 [marine sediment metagenome]|uniref:Uncharacterized protein n=1 Tax=marine sediment metagenome TaxID=412755 RepID=A0A0F9AWH7_9ZZZZ
MTEPSQPDTDSSTHLEWHSATHNIVEVDTHEVIAREVARIDGERIVRAVNNHAKLLAMLERVLTTTLEIDRTLGHGHFNPGTLQKMADVITEAQS